MLHFLSAGLCLSHRTLGGFWGMETRRSVSFSENSKISERQPTTAL